MASMEVENNIIENDITVEEGVALLPTDISKLLITFLLEKCPKPGCGKYGDECVNCEAVCDCDPKCNPSRGSCSHCGLVFDGCVECHRVYLCKKCDSMVCANGVWTEECLQDCTLCFDCCDKSPKCIECRGNVPSVCQPPTKCSSCKRFLCMECDIACYDCWNMFCPGCYGAEMQCGCQQEMEFCRACYEKSDSSADCFICDKPCCPTCGVDAAQCDGTIRRDVCDDCLADSKNYCSEHKFLSCESNCSVCGKLTLCHECDPACLICGKDLCRDCGGECEGCGDCVCNSCGPTCIGCANSGDEGSKEEGDYGMDTSSEVSSDSDTVSPELSDKSEKRKNSPSASEDNKVAKKAKVEVQGDCNQ